MTERLFKPGDYVRCVRPDPYQSDLFKGAIYRVTEVDAERQIVTCEGFPHGLSFDRFDPVTVIDGTGPWVVWSKHEAVPELHLAYESALAAARDRAEDAPGTVLLVSRVSVRVMSKVIVMEASPTAPEEVGP